MPKLLPKNFYHYCFPNFKCLPTALPLPFEEEDEFEIQHSHKNNNIPITNITKNFNSVYDIPSDSTTSKSLTNSSTLTEDFNYIFDDSDSDSPDSVPDFSTVFASRRFFFSSPGNSNSIVDFPAPEKLPEEEIVTGGVAIQTYSPDPYSDFRRSMQEMVEAHELTDVKANWEFLHQLLLCYLNLNPKHAHKYIVGAFSDLVVSLMSSTTTIHDDNRRKVVDAEQHGKSSSHRQ